MRTIVFSNHYTGKPLQILESCVSGDFVLKVLKSAEQKALLEAVGEADYLMVSGRLKIDREVIDRAQKLRMVQRTGVGLDNIDLAYLRSRGIPLYVNSGVNANSVAEYTLMLMLSALKRSYAVNCRMRNGIWKKQETALSTHEICGKTIGIVGMGNIGRRVAKMLSGFGVEVIYSDIRRLPDREEMELGISCCDFEELLCRSDILTLHCPYLPEKGYLIAEKELEAMKQGAVLINTARGKLVKQSALIDALRAGKISAAGMDVFEEEPVPGISGYSEFDNVLLSPHIAGLSCETFERMISMAVDNIRAFDRGDNDRIAPSLFMGE